MSINMFGSRMTDTIVMGYVWITIAVISHLRKEQLARQADASGRVDVGPAPGAST